MRPIKPQQQSNSNNFFKTNEQIKANEVRLLDQNGDMVGVLSFAAAMQMARDINLDLIEISPNVTPPVCKLASVGKMKYEMQKKAADAKKKQKVVETKEIKMTINIGKGDYDVKIRHTKEFIEKGNKVKVSIRMKGREITHRELAEQMMVNILKDTEEFAKPEMRPRLEGMQMIAIMIKK